MEKKSWDEFRDCKLLWFINTILHVFGWAIVAETTDGKVTNVYPARVKFRGFAEQSNTEGYKLLSKYMMENAEQLYLEASDNI